MKYYADALEKVYISDLDRLKELIKSQYSSHGRPAVNQPELFRSVVLASHFKKSISSIVSIVHYPVLLFSIKLIIFPAFKKNRIMLIYT